nr:hypothetical protein [Desulfobacterales bacterium]
MTRGKFPFAHIDIMCISDGKSYLCEISLNGGLEGAQIRREQLNRIKNDLLKQKVEEITRFRKEAR